jgi:hypothetical protein
MKYGDVVERLGIRLRTMLPRKLTAFLGYHYRIGISVPIKISS